MREIKFRAWDKLDGMTDCFSVHSSGLIAFKNNEWLHDSKKPILMQYTGLKDKNGKEIYEGDILKIKYQIMSEYYSESFYKVTYSRLGVELIFIKLSIDDGKNQVPIIQSLKSFDHFEVDGRNGKYENIAISDYALCELKCLNYSNDIEIIGNIYENPDLLEKNHE